MDLQANSIFFRGNEEKYGWLQTVFRFGGWNNVQHFILVQIFTSYFFYVVRTVHFGMKMYNDQRNAQAFNLFIYLLLPYMFQAVF
jgi:hypothetical protein